MARYLLVQVDENDRAERLRVKLNAVEGLLTIGMFAKPTLFCECEQDSGRSERYYKFGWWLCPQCRRPKKDTKQYGLVNLLDQPQPPVEYWNINLTIREPYQSPYERTGRKVILKKLEMIAENWKKIQRRKKRRPRARR